MSNRNRRMSSILGVMAVVGTALAIVVPAAHAGRPGPAPPVKYQLELLPLPEGSTAGYTGKMNASGDVGGLADGATRGFTGERGFLYRSAEDETVELNDLVFNTDESGYVPPSIVPALPVSSDDPQSPATDWLSSPKPFIVSAGDISDDGKVIGAFWYRCKEPGSTTATTTETRDGEIITHYWMHNAFRYTPAAGDQRAVFEDLGTVPNQEGSRDIAINNQGHVLCVTESSGFHFVWTDIDTFTLDGIPDSPDRWVTNINELGEVAGILYTTAWNTGSHAFVYNYTTEEYTDLGYLNDAPARTQPQSWAFGLNSASPRQTVGGSVVGYDRSISTAISHAFRHTEGVGMKDLGVLTNGYAAYGYSVNKWGDVAGICYMNSKSPTQRRAFLYLDGWGMLDVWNLIEDTQGTDGHIYPYSVSINDSGVMAGSLWDGRPFILRPIQWVRE
jgi:probable HAF family extracellular repeat protein